MSLRSLQSFPVERIDQGNEEWCGKFWLLVSEEPDVSRGLHCGREPDVDVHLFGISMDVPFNNISVTNLVPNDVLEGEGVDFINADGFDSDHGEDD
ncbi:hypothetical protein Tco_0870917 [Tanacetum coccineum]